MDTYCGVITSGFLRSRAADRKYDVDISIIIKCIIATAASGETHYVHSIGLAYQPMSWYDAVIERLQRRLVGVSVDYVETARPDGTNERGIAFDWS